MAKIKEAVGKLICGFMAGALFFIFSAPCYADTDSPMAQIRSSVDNVIAILRDEKNQGEEGKETKRSLIIKEVDKRFNFPLMAKLSLGDVWGRISVRQQDQFCKLFGELLKNTYINRVEGYSDERVIYGQEQIKNDLAQVSSVFEKNNNRLSIIYKLRKENSTDWLVYDVIIEGASLIKQYRRQFAQIIEQEEFSGLILRLEDKMKAINKT